MDGECNVAMECNWHALVGATKKLDAKAALGQQPDTGCHLCVIKCIISCDQSYFLDAFMDRPHGHGALKIEEMNIYLELSYI